MLLLVVLKISRTRSVAAQQSTTTVKFKYFALHHMIHIVLHFSTHFVLMSVIILQIIAYWHRCVGENTREYEAAIDDHSADPITTERQNQLTLFSSGLHAVLCCL